MEAAVNQLHDEVRGAWRFRWPAMIAAWVICLIGWIVVILLPDVYQASARVYVDTRTKLSPLLKGLAVESNLASELAIVRQALLSRPQLEEVARKTDLDLRAKTPEAREAMIDKLIAKITIEHANGRRGEDHADGLYVISYEDSDRDMAKQVVQTLLQNFVDDTSKGTGSDSAQRFLQDQITTYERRLNEAEQRLSDFKREHVGLIPGEGGGYFERLQREIEEINKLKAQLRVASTRREALAAQLRGEKAYVPTGGAGPNGPPEGSLAYRIQEQQSLLDELRLRFTDKHPSVVAAKETLAQLKVRQQDELQALASGDLTDTTIPASANPIYQTIQLNMNQIDVEIAALRGQIQDREQRRAELEKAVDTVPKVEAELARLNRDYGVTQQKYQELVSRLEQARLSEKAEVAGVWQFRVIDPPVASLEPVKPLRALIATGVLVVGLALGVALAYLLHQVRPSFSSVRSLAEVTGLPVLGSVGRVWPQKRIDAERRRLMMFSAATAMLLVTFCVFLLIHQQAAGFAHKLLT
jgi:polysaccharide chain length determinant protein (PEP-CTERM system associated)